MDRDREAFEASRAQFERSMAERERKLKAEQERLHMEWSRLRIEQGRKSGGGVATTTETITVKTLKEAQELDVKDGIIDGKFEGKQIIIQGMGPLVPPPQYMGKRVGPPKMASPGRPAPPPGSSPPRFVLGQAPQLGGKGGKGGRG